MKTLIAAAAIAICLGSASSQAQSGSGQLVMEKALSPHGTLAVDINVADLKIMPGTNSGGIRLEMQTRRPVGQTEVASWVRRFEVAANRASLDVHVPKSPSGCNDCDVTVLLYVPQQTDLEVDLGVGDIRIHGIRGDKRVHVDVGDLRIGYASPGEYGHVETRTRIGDIHDPLNQSDQSGFLGKSEEFTLSGRYHLNASVGVGDLDLFQEGNS